MRVCKSKKIQPDLICSNKNIPICVAGLGIHTNKYDRDYA